MQRFIFLTVCSVAFCFAAFAGNSTTKQTISSIRELGRGDQNSLPALAKYLDDPDRDIRAEAVKAIVKIDTMHSIDPLLKAMHDNDSEIQFRSIDGVVNAYVPGYVARNNLGGLFTKGVRQVKSIFSQRNETVVDADVKIRPDIAAALSEKITGGNGMDVRSDAALAAGILRARDSVPALEKGLRSKDTDVIFECLIALQKIKDPAAGPSVDFLAHDLDDRVQTTALETLGVLGSLTSADDIRSAFKNARNAKVQRAALQALAMLGLSADRALFLQYAESSDPEMRSSALEGLGRVRAPDDYPKLKTAFEEANADWRVHEAAAFAMAMEGDYNTEVLGPLQLLVEGLSVRQRANVSQAYLAELVQKPEARAALGKILPETAKDQKIAILDVLSSVGAPDSIQIIQQYTADQDRDIAFAAMRAARIAQTRSAS